MLVDLSHNAFHETLWGKALQLLSLRIPATRMIYTSKLDILLSKT